MLALAMATDIAAQSTRKLTPDALFAIADSTEESLHAKRIGVEAADKELLAAMTGDYHEAETYMTKLSVGELGDCHIVEVGLDDDKARGGISKVEARYDKATKRISTIMMHYTNGDYTSYTLEGVKLNTALDESLFVIERK